MTEGLLSLPVILRTTYRSAVDLYLDGVLEAIINTMDYGELWWRVYDTLPLLHDPVSYVMC